MASSAGFQLVAGRIPGERIAGTLRTSSSGNITTTETTVDTVTAPLVSGRTYGIWWFSQAQSSVAADTAVARLREDNSTGTRMTIKRMAIPESGQNYQIAHYGEYVAVSTGDKTFVGTLTRGSGTGNITSPASSTSLCSIYVEYVSG